MSLPWNRSLQLQVGMQEVQGTLRPAWARRKVLARASHAFDLTATPHDAEAPISGVAAADPQSRAMDAVLSQLRTSAKNRTVRLSVVLADERIHFDVVAGDYGGASERQLQLIACACVAELLGDAAAHQVIRWQLQPDLHHLFICAISHQDIESVVQAASRHGLTLASLQPEFCLQWNQHAALLPEGSGVFAASCGAHAIIACAARGAITALSYGPWLADERLSHGDFTGKNPLDARVDRLLASVGLDADHVSTFVLVAADVSTRKLDSRWTVIDRQEAP